MLVATGPSGPVEAGREIPTEAFACPVCRDGVILKRGRIKVAHFAHVPGADCGAAGESPRHLLGKRVLADEFRAIGYRVTLEDSYPQMGRRVDVAVAMPTGHRVAVEVQDSPIPVAEMKRRMAADRRLGFFGTAWVFTGRRHDILAVPDGAEVRVPEEMRWLSSRYCKGVFILDGPSGALFQATFGGVYREGTSTSWYEPGGVLAGEDYPGRFLTATRSVNLRPVRFALSPHKSPWHRPHRPDWGVGFAPGGCT